MESRSEEAWRDATLGSHKGDWEWIAREMFCAMSDMESKHCLQMARVREQHDSLQGEVEELEEKLEKVCKK